MKTPMTAAEMIYTCEGQLNWLDSMWDRLLPMAKDGAEKYGKGAFLISLSDSIEAGSELTLQPMYFKKDDLLERLPAGKPKNALMRQIEKYNSKSQVVVAFYDGKIGKVDCYRVGQSV